MIGQGKIAILITEKAQGLIGLLVPSITDIADKTGIINIGTPNVIIPETCLSSEEINKIAKLRDDLKNKLNSTAKIIERLSLPINTLSNVVTGTTIALGIVSAAKNTLNASLIPLPAAPGVSIPTINNLSTLEDFLTPKIATAQVAITSIEIALDFANAILLKLLESLRTIDEYLKKCGGPDGPSDDSYLVKTEETAKQANSSTSNNNEIYKGFALEIIEEPYSPTVNRRQAVAKNNNGIILLKTSLSFTTNNKVLIEELKLIIDKSNLKAY